MDTNEQDRGPTSDDSEIVSYVMEKVNRWREHRNQQYKDDWDKYYSVWSGKFIRQLQGKQAERSRLIAPATQNAVDQTVSEMVEATFGRGKWFDLADDNDPQKQQMAEVLRDNLIDDFDRDRMSSVITDVYYNGAIFGTGISKRIIERGSTNKVYWEAIRPYNFVIDTSATKIDDALGVAHEAIRPKHEIANKQIEGEYKKGALGDTMLSPQQHGPTTDLLDLTKGSLGTELEIDPEDGVHITEWHGLVPAKFLNKPQNDPKDDVLADLLDEHGEPDDDEALTEAIIVIGNGSTLLKCEENPIKNEMGQADRGFVAYQHHKRPNSFWGIGQVEKGANAQAALDSELRARIDALGLLTYPIVGMDASRLPKNLNTQLTPGKAFLTNGRPSEIIEPLSFGNLNPASFQQSADFERMVQMATGANDPSTPVNINRKNETSSGVSMQQGSYIKRAKLTMQNVDSDFLDPLVRKSLFAYMAVAPQRYPHEVSFSVNSTMSIMAREFEQMQMTNLLAIIPQESPAFLEVLSSIVENYSGPSKDKIMAGIDQLKKPDPQKQQMQQMQAQLALQKMQKEVEYLQSQIDEVRTRAGLNQAKAQGETTKAQMAGQQLQLQVAQTAIQARQADVSQQQVQVQAAKLHVDREKNHLAAHVQVKNAAQKQPTSGGE